MIQLVQLVAWRRGPTWSRWHVIAVGDPQVAARTDCGLLIERARLQGVTTRAVRLDDPPRDVCASCWEALTGAVLEPERLQTPVGLS